MTHNIGGSEIVREQARQAQAEGTTREISLGARVCDRGVCFRVWAENARHVEVAIMGVDGKELQSHALERDGEGYFSGKVQGIGAGALYMYRLDAQQLRPDPASRYQPAGVHGPSQVVNLKFAWSDGGWRGTPLEEMVIYEVHVGTFTREGTFEALAGRLPYLKTLGITAIELMPVADFPGDRNWGYDGVSLYAPSRVYGGPEELKKLVNEAHKQGLSVIQDVVYNHLGPDGNYLRDFSKGYFTPDKMTPWGDALDYSVPQVRDFLVQNALYWVHEHHMDGLRLDATHAIMDDSEEHILSEIARRVHNSVDSERHVVLIAEDERNDARLIRPREEGGMGLDAVWADDFHHQVRVALEGEPEGYFMDFTGSAQDIATTLKGGWFYRGQYSKHLKRKRGSDAGDLPLQCFVYCLQNHDQIGNRALGDRLSASVGIDAYRAASVLLLLSPYTPLLFQGQEWGASTPFLFFTDHHAELGRQVTEGRQSDFAHFEGFDREVPDPQASETFLASKLRWDEIRRNGQADEHADMLEFYRSLLTLRRKLLPPRLRSREHFSCASVGGSALAMRYSSRRGGQGDVPADVLVVVNLGEALSLELSAGAVIVPPKDRRWRVALSTGEWHKDGGEPSVGQEVTGTLSTGSPSALVLVSE